jgi:phosphonoacetaldehyde hydrolase
MTFYYRRTYRGRLRAAILDWAGTTVDFGCIAPAAAFAEAFAAFDVPISIAEARAPMGVDKRAHIRGIAAQPRIAITWTERHDRGFSDEDYDALYERFLAVQMAMVERHSTLILGVREAVAAMRARGMKVGSTTGYPQEVMAPLMQLAASQGYEADCVVCADDTPIGRPSPFPALKALMELAVFPVESVVKIGDTVVDVEEGLNGGMWTIAVTVSGNEVGMSRGEWSELSLSEQARLRDRAAAKLLAAGAHYVIDTLAHVCPVLDDIEARLARGEKP